MTENTEVQTEEQEAPPVEETPRPRTHRALQLTFVPEELRQALDDEAEELQLPTTRYVVGLLEGLSLEQRMAAFTRSRAERAQKAGKRITMRDPRKSPPTPEHLA